MHMLNDHIHAHIRPNESLNTEDQVYKQVVHLLCTYRE